MAVGWVDNKAVHFVSNADTTDVVTVQRKVGNGKVDVISPLAAANYNKLDNKCERDEDNNNDLDNEEKLLIFFQYKLVRNLPSNIEYFYKKGD